MQTRLEKRSQKPFCVDFWIVSQTRFISIRGKNHFNNVLRMYQKRFEIMLEKNPQSVMK